MVVGDCQEFPMVCLKELISISRLLDFILKEGALDAQSLCKNVMGNIERCLLHDLDGQILFNSPHTRGIHLHLADLHNVFLLSLFLICDKMRKPKGFPFWITL